MSMRGWEGDGGDVRQAPAVAEAPQEDGGGAQNESAATKVPTTRRKRQVLSETHLLSDDGFKKIYATFPFQVSGGVAGQEAHALNSLIRMYKQWAYDLYPGLNFEDFIDRAEALGKTHGVQGLMSDLRTKEMRRALHLPDHDDPSSAERDLVDVDRMDDAEEMGFIAPGGHSEDESEEEAML
ncbi:hypothetical protein ATCC90586_007560 [Pythium insidiosum]|nr:hypothetical protein ATCC90586_007560 [Pythium insidiosum]